MWTDEQIKELAEKHGWYGVGTWWQQSIPRFRAMLEEYAAQPGMQRIFCTDCETEVSEDDVFCPKCGLRNPANLKG